MARSISIPSRVYGPQTLEQSVDAFPVGVKELRVSLSREAWPGTPADTVAILSVSWAEGGGAQFGLPGGVILGRDGQPLAASVVSLDVPRDAIGPKQVAGGTFSLQILQTLRTAISIAAS